MIKTNNSNTRKLAIIIAVFLIAVTIFTVIAPTMAYADDMFSGIINADGSIKEGSASAAGTNNSLSGFVSRYKSIVSLITGIAAITMLIFMVIQILKLGSAGDNESARRKAIGGILTTGIATALLGGISIVVTFFWNILSQT